MASLRDVSDSFSLIDRAGVAGGLLALCPAVAGRSSETILVRYSLLPEHAE